MISYGVALLIVGIVILVLGRLIALPRFVILGNILGTVGVVLLVVGLLLNFAPIHVDTGTETLKGLIA